MHTIAYILYCYLMTHSSFAGAGSGSSKEPVLLKEQSAILPTFNLDNVTNVAQGIVKLDASLVSPGTSHLPMFSPTACLPRKLVGKIQNLDFVEMSELLPEAWFPDVDNSVASVHGRKPRRRTPVANSLVWTECYALMAAVLAEKFPNIPSCLLT